MSSPLPYIAATDQVVGANHPTLPDTLNRALRQILADLGFDPDAAPNPLLVALTFGAHGDTSYTLGDGTVGGQARVYSQIKAYGSAGSDGADLVLLAAKSRGVSGDFDVHIGNERAAGVDSTGVLFIDTNIKVADFLQSPFRGHGLQILQANNSVVFEFPISGGILLMPGKLQGQNGANLDLVVLIGGASGSFVVQKHDGSANLLTLAESTGNLSVTGSVTGTLGLVSNTRVVDTVVGLTWGTNIAVNAAAGNQHRVSASSNIAATFTTPTNAPTGSFSQRLWIEVYNSSGGALGTPPAFDSGYVLNGAVGNPANNTEIVYQFCWNSGRAKWIEVGTHSATGL